MADCLCQVNRQCLEDAVCCVDVFVGVPVRVVCMYVGVYVQACVVCMYIHMQTHTHMQPHTTHAPTHIIEAGEDEGNGEEDSPRHYCRTAGTP